jgi:hypothetical protein
MVEGGSGSGSGGGLEGKVSSVSSAKASAAGN